MGRYNFASPGAAAGDALLDTLARQRAEARQDMLNQITAQNAESQRAMTAQNIKESQFNILGKRVADTESGLETDADLSGLDPEIRAEMAKRGHVKKHGAPIASVGTSTDFQLPNASAPGPENSGDDSDHSADPMLAIGGDSSPAPATPPAPEGEYFIGKKEDRDRARHAAALAALGPQLKDPNLTQLQRILMMQAAMEEDRLPGQAFTASQPEKPYSIYDPVENTFTQAKPGPDGQVPTAPPGDNPVIMRSRPPREAIYHPTTTFIGTDDKGHPVSTIDGVPYVIGEDGKRKVYSGVLGAKPSNSSNKSAQMPAALRNHLDKARGAATGKAGLFSSSAPDPQKVAEYQNAQDNFISAYPTKSADVKDTVGEIIRHPEDTRSLDELIQAHQGVFTNPQDLADFADLLRVVRGS